jgi:hypothetical protein
MEVIPRLKVLTSVRTLTLHVDQPGRYQCFFFPCYQNVLTDLTISGSVDIPDLEIIEMICSFPLLERLVLDHKGHYSTPRFRSCLKISENLRSLQINPHLHEYILEWFSAMTPPPPLRMLHFTEVSTQPLPYPLFDLFFFTHSSAGTLLHNLGSLEHLELSTSHPDGSVAPGKYSIPATPPSFFVYLIIPKQYHNHFSVRSTSDMLSDFAHS